MFVRILLTILTSYELYRTVLTLQLCSDLLSFNDAGDIRHAHFDVSFRSFNSFVQVTAFVSKECQKDSCYLYFEKPERSDKDRDVADKPLRFSILFSETPSKAWVSGIVVRNTSGCYLLCTQNNEEAGLQSLQLTYYPYGEGSAIVFPCDPTTTYRSSTRFAESCGMTEEKPKFLELAVGGKTIKRGSWPWLAAIYRGYHDSFKFNCGATLVSQSTLLTAAHCVFNEGGRLLRPDEIGVQLGKHDLSSFREEGSVFRQASKIMVHEDYRPSATNRDSDIALIIVDTDVIYTPLIKPACLWMDEGEIDKLANQTGTVVGWGVDESKEISTVPKKVTARIVSYDDCINSHSTFESLTTRRNFCAGNLDGTGPCQGDSGGALMLEVSGRWTVRGIVSVSLALEYEACDLHQYVVYTDVAKYKEWINKNIPRSSISVPLVASYVVTYEEYDQLNRDNKFVQFLKESKIADEIDRKTSLDVSELMNLFRTPYFDKPSTPIQSEVVNSSSSDDALCGKKGTNVPEGFMPWTAALYRNFVYSCVGTIISLNAIVTAAHCLEKYIVANEYYHFVVVGSHNPQHVAEGQTLDVSEVILHPSYRGLDVPSADVAIIRTNGSIMFSSLSRPACIWPDVASDSKDVIGKVGHVSGWGRTDLTDKSAELLEVLAPIVSRETCEEHHLFLQHLARSGNFCAGKLDGNDPCYGFDGSGLLIERNNIWYLRGILSAKLNPYSCRSYTMYTDVAQFRKWIIDTAFV